MVKENLHIPASPRHKRDFDYHTPGKCKHNPSLEPGPRARCVTQMLLLPQDQPVSQHGAVWESSGVRKALQEMAVDPRGLRDPEPAGTARKAPATPRQGPH